MSITIVPKIIILKGIPGSGKTTWAKDYQRQNPNTKRVNKDELRMMIDDGQWSKNNENFVLSVRDSVIRSALKSGYDIIVDDTNFAPHHEKTLRQIAQSIGAQVEVHIMDTPLEECILRDSKRPKPVGERIIREMYQKYVKPKVEEVPFDPTLPTAVICDIDGTLAHMKSRKPYDWQRVGEDELDPRISILLATCKQATDTIILVSGRDGSCRPETETWLQKNNVQYDHLYMRPAGDNRKDTIIKQEILDAHIKGKYNVLFVLDDRDQVVEMWRQNGYKCLQVAEGNF